MLTRHYQKNKEDLSKKRYRILSEKEKEKKYQYVCKRYKNL